jgi:thioredoxin
MIKKILAIIVLTVLIVSVYADEPVKPEHLTIDSFKEKVFDFDNNEDWNYQGELPAIIDFYADWCGPCRKIAPIMEELAQEYEGKLVIYKVDTEDQKELAGMFGIRSIPSILFVPVEDRPQMITGAFPKEKFQELIKDILKVE